MWLGLEGGADCTGSAGFAGNPTDGDVAAPAVFCSFVHANRRCSVSAARLLPLPPAPMRFFALVIQFIVVPA
jgi:hypothetical protein